ncbi:rhodanese-like domain-containing protein [Trichloromonas sp.]|uniref:rhodanese-like domain-containing protein n=1 Tax=Trichloromonas sp. TaxID=3069249 RepID=UPI003D816DFF
MGFVDYFRPVPGLSAEEVRRFLQRHGPDEYLLLDVRQPGEYEQGHLPGAMLVPLASLREQVGRLDPQKTTIVYCASGVRSRAATAVLLYAGFREVFNMNGGIRAWLGGVAGKDGAALKAWFAPAANPEQHLALAWYLEDGTRRFYAELSCRSELAAAAALLKELAGDEERHQATLMAIYEGVSGRKAGSGFPAGILSEEPGESVMEGGLSLCEALAWSHSKPMVEILELAMALELNAYDRYLVLWREAEDDGVRRVFEVFSDEEKRHLERLTKVYEAGL